MTAPFYDLEVSHVNDPNDAVEREVAQLSDDEQRILKKLRSQLRAYARRNKRKQAYYEASQMIKHLDIAVPRTMTDIATAVGWAGTVVDVLDERIDFLGWESPNGNVNGLDVIYNDNNLNIEMSLGHVDAMTTGTSFVAVGNDDEYGVDRQLVTVESSSTATVLWDYRKRRSEAGLSQTVDDKGKVLGEVLYLPDETITLKRDTPDAKWEVVDRDPHGAGRCFLTRLPNRSRPYQLDGRSEITRAVRYYTDAAVRTLLGMEVNREFYTAPQRFVLNAKPEDFGVTDDMSAQEKFRIGLSVAMGMINIIPGRTDNTEGDPVSVVEMKAQPPTPYIEQVKSYSVLLSAETGMPVEYFGFTTDNPPSADSIRQREYRLVKRATRRNGAFGVAMREVGLLCLLARDGDVDVEFVRNLRAAYADPSTPTRAATADELQKAVASEILVPTGRVVKKRFGLSELEIAQEEQDAQKYEAKKLRDMMQEQAMAAAQAATTNANSNAAPNGQQRPRPTREGGEQ